MNYGSSKKYTFTITKVPWPGHGPRGEPSPEDIDPPDEAHDWDLLDVAVYGYSSQTENEGTQEEVLIALWRRPR